MTKDPKAKLNDIETRMRRWHTRLTRASNMLQKLEKQRRRLVSPVRTMAERTAEQKATGKMPPFVTVTPEPFGVVEHVAEQLDIPPFLNRADPLIAEKMTAARKKAEAEARKAMPLTGKAAIDYIKAPPKKRKA